MEGRTGTIEAIERAAAMLESSGQWLPLSKAQRLQGDMLRQMGKLYQAKRMYEAAMQSYQKTDMAQEPLEEAYLLDRFTALLMDAGSIAEAHAFITRALAIRQRVLGMNHEETIMTRYLLDIAEQQLEIDRPGSNVLPFRKKGR